MNLALTKILNTLILFTSHSAGYPDLYHNNIMLNQSQKASNLKIRQSPIYYTGLLGRWDKRIVDQESDVPSIIFFILFTDLGYSKLFNFIFVIL